MADLPRPRSDVLLSAQQERHFLTDLESGAMYELNESAAVAWKALASASRLSALLDALAAHYPEVDRSVLAVDMKALLKWLQEAGLVVPSGPNEAPTATSH